MRGKVSSNPSQVERYGALIQQESERLGAIVEQVLRFASTKAGRVVQERQPVSIAGLIDETVQSNKGMLEDTLCEVQTHLQPGLPAITGDSLALRHALQNLLANAAKYGLPGKQTVEIYARSLGGVKRTGSRNSRRRSWSRNTCRRNRSTCSTRFIAAKKPCRIRSTAPGSACTW